MPSPRGARTGPPAGTAPAVSRSGRLTPVVPALMSLGLGCWGLSRQDSMWRDESVTYQMAHRSMTDMARALSHIDAVHGLYYVLMHAVFSLWDGGLFALRLPSVLAIALATWLVGAVATRHADALTGLLAGLVFALLPIVQQYAQEGRSYALVTASVAGTLLAFDRALARDRARDWLLYGVLALLAALLHEFAILALLANAVTLRLTKAPRTLVRRWAVAAAAATTGLLPLAILSLGQSDEQLGWLNRPSVGAWLLYAGVVVLGAACARFAFGGARKRYGPFGDGGYERGRHPLVALALPVLALPSLLLMAISLVHPWYVDRYCVYSYLGLALVAGPALRRCLTLLAARPLPYRVAMTALPLALASAVLAPWYVLMRTPEARKDDVVAVTRAADELGEPGDAVLFEPARRREWSLSYPRTWGRFHDIALAVSPAASGTLQGSEVSAGRVKKRLLAQRRVLALRDPAGQPLDDTAAERAKREVLDRYFTSCGTRTVHGARVTLYARAHACASHHDGR
ncbi:glycosyltransferase family 39 protein [Streptomyces sp. NPDC007084]|uniref:glycosyltransferase family 39 protein n=1 Tax=Streptomyces sp. NPDC007084 TaxID=3154313 RepID=UPI00345644BF